MPRLILYMRDFDNQGCCTAVRAMRAALVLALVLLSLAGCGRPEGSSDPATSLEVSNAPLSKPVEPLLLTKEGKPYIMFDVTPLMRGIKPEDATAILLRAALSTAIEKALPSPKYDKMDSFTMRMVYLNSYDECGRPKWGDAFDLAILRTSRARMMNLNATDLAEVDEATLSGYFDEVDLKVENLRQALDSTKY